MSFPCSGRSAFVAMAVVGAVALLPGWSQAKNLRQSRNERARMAGDGLRLKEIVRHPGTEILVNERSRTIEILMSEEAVPGAGQDGDARAKEQKVVYRKLVVKNFSSYTADVFWSLDDTVTPWYDGGTLPPRWKLKLRLLRGFTYLVAAEAYPDEDAYWDWGPRSIFLWKKSTWSLFN